MQKEKQENFMYKVYTYDVSAFIERHENPSRYTIHRINDIISGIGNMFILFRLLSKVIDKTDWIILTGLSTSEMP